MNIKNIIIGVIIAVVFVMFCAYGTNLVYKSPDYMNFCNFTYAPTKIISSNCTISTSLDLKTQTCYNNRGVPVPVYDENGCQKDITCSDCQQKFDKADESYSRNMFIISLVIGVIMIAISALLISVSSVAGGLMLGSLFFIIYGTGRYWRFMDDWMRFIILGIALAILIYLGYRIANRTENKKVKKK